MVLQHAATLLASCGALILAWRSGRRNQIAWALFWILACGFVLRLDFLLYWKLDLTPLMSLAGNRWRATEYLMGNHVIAETMYRHDPAVALYVPLRLAIYDSEEGTRFTIEQPSSTLSSLGQDEITQVGIDLNRKLATLLSALNVEVPMALSQSSAVA